MPKSFIKGAAFIENVIVILMCDDWSKSNVAVLVALLNGESMHHNMSISNALVLYC